MLVNLVVLCAADAATLNWWPMPPGINPRMDGMASFANEWSYANWAPNDQNDGTFYAEWQRNWSATSTANNTTTYMGVSLFDLHSMEAATTLELADYNVFEYTLLTGGPTIKAWVFANADEPNDASWLSNSGLGGGYSSVDDRGFIVRLNGNPASDYHWLPGDPEPGDAAWNWALTYGFFGSSGFNDSVAGQGLPNATIGENEVYEVVLYGPSFGMPGAPGPDFTPCITDIYRKICDPRAGQPPQELVEQMVGPGHVVIPEPSTLVLAGIGAIVVAFKGIRLRRTA